LNLDLDGKKRIKRLRKVGKMIKNRKELEKFENQIIRKEKLSIKKKFLLMDAMYKEAVALGSFPLKDALSGLDIDIKIAKVINSVS